MTSPGTTIPEAPQLYTDALPRYQSASGAIITIDAPGYDLSQPWFSSFRLRLEPPYTAGGELLRNRAFQVGPVGIVELHTEYILKGEIVDRLSFAGGSLVVARSHVDERGLAAWQGRWHAVYAWLNTPGTTVSTVIGLFDRLEFVDSPAGVVVRTGSVPAETLYAEQVTKHIPGAGLLSITPAQDAMSLIPTWSGARVRSGEVWQKTVPTATGTARWFLHASPTAVTVVEREPNELADSVQDTQRLTFLDQLAGLSWVG